MAITKDWVLTQDGFDKLLALFDTDTERAAEKYEFIRLHLIKIFENRGCNPSRELADEVINRVIRKIETGDEIISATLTNFFFGIARNVLREYQRSPENALPSIDADVVADNHAAIPRESIGALFNNDFASQSERELDCLEACLEKLPPETKRLIVSYYDWSAGDKIPSRKRLANELGVTLNSLRIRAHRIRDELEKCALKCMNESDPDGQ